MDHRQPRNRRAEIRDADAFETSDVGRAEISPAESDAREPGGYRPAGGQHHLRGQAVFDERGEHGVKSLSLANWAKRLGYAGASGVRFYEGDHIVGQSVCQFRGRG